MKRSLVLSALSISALVLAACGGGGGGGSAAAPVVPPASAPGAPVAPQNSVAVVVDGGPLVDGQSLGVPNVAYVSVKVCSPGSSSSCVTVDHVQVDTGSSGLRILASALAKATPLPAATTADNLPLAECARFAAAQTWGAVRRADVRIGGETALDIPVQVISDTAVGAEPTDCGASADAMSDVATLSANGILGIGNAVTDCAADVCAATNRSVTYYTCAGATCTGVAVAASLQVANPVAAFAQDNNGSVLTLPAIGAQGSHGVSGTLVFGIGTQADNALGAATVLTLDAASGTFLTNFGGKTYVGFLDSGSNFTTFTDSAIPQCAQNPGFYCPGTTLSLQATNVGRNGASASIDFSIADAEALAAAAPDAVALNNVAISPPAGVLSGATFDFGLTFFYGRSVFTALDGRMAAGTVGPWVAY